MVDLSFIHSYESVHKVLWITPDKCEILSRNVLLFPFLPQSEQARHSSRTEILNGKFFMDDLKVGTLPDSLTKIIRGKDTFLEVMKDVSDTVNSTMEFIVKGCDALIPKLQCTEKQGYRTVLQRMLQPEAEG
ncbi:hypothetical protein J6590_016905 [Homalodisca vitripennis]|nr:hypothetical protein J6590_016905 [Homalodisca vitripennis]